MIADADLDEIERHVLAHEAPVDDLDDGACADCGEAMGLDPGCAPTATCHRCARALADRVEPLVAALRQARAALATATRERDEAHGELDFHKAPRTFRMRPDGKDLPRGIGGRILALVEKVRADYAAELTSSVAGEVATLTLARQEAQADVKRLTAENVAIAARLAMAYGFIVDGAVVWRANGDADSRRDRWYIATPTREDPAALRTPMQGPFATVDAAFAAVDERRTQRATEGRR